MTKNLSRSISLSISAIRALEIEKDEAELIAANARAAAIRQADLQKQFNHQTRQLNLRFDAQDEHPTVYYMMSFHFIREKGKRRYTGSDS